MDVKITNGDLALNADGSLDYLYGIDEAVQRVLIAASVQRGAFLYHRGLGTDYGTLGADDPMIREKLDLLLREATAGITDADVQVIGFDRDTMTASVKVKTADGERTTEVKLNGILRTNP
jgi:hypothetical protein